MIERAVECGRRGLGAGLVVLLGGFGPVLTGCSVPPPTVQQGLDYGFRTPKQAFASWRTAVQGDLLAAEYRCFSRRWKLDNGAKTLLRYATARDEILRQFPQLRWAVYRAEEPEIVEAFERAVVLEARIPGPLWFKDRYLVVGLVREGYWEAYTEDYPEEPELGDDFPDPIDAGVLQYDERYDAYRVVIDDFSVQADEVSHEALIQLTAGWQWKVREFVLRDSPWDEGQDQALPSGLE